MPLTEQQKKTLRGLGHPLKPLILVGAGGLSPPLLVEFDRALEQQELLKVKVKAGDRRSRDALIAELCQHSGAELVQRTGNVGLLFRRRRRDSRFTAL
jgi:RNA-binding protein